MSDKRHESAATAAPVRNRRKVAGWLVSADQDGQDRGGRCRGPVKHPLYGKVMRRTSRFEGATTKNNACGIGDRVSIMETRPLSATKRWGAWWRSSKRPSDHRADSPRNRRAPGREVGCWFRQAPFVDGETGRH